MFALRAPAVVRAPVAPAPRRQSLVARADAAVADAPSADSVEAPTVVVLEKKRSRRFKEAKAKVRCATWYGKQVVGLGAGARAAAY